MKNLIIITLILFISISSKATTIPLDSIRVCIVSFLNETDYLSYSSASLPNFLIFDRGKQEAISEEKEGIFVFGTLSSGVRTHFLLVEKDSFQILNMTDPINQNVLKLLHFFERNCQYSKDDILFYMKDLVVTYQRNEEYISSFKGLIM